jgi:NADH-quinone oxidoreductase subunit E
MSPLTPERRARAEQLVTLYPHPRSALIPICHIAQEQEGHLTRELMIEVAELVGVTPAEVQGTVTFYDMFHTDPVGDYVVGVCTNIACLLAGGEELLEHAEEKLGVRRGGTTADGAFTLEETECLADCDIAPCVQVNSRFVRTTTPEELDALIDELVAGTSTRDLPSSGTLNRVTRSVGLVADPDVVAQERHALREGDAQGKATS